MKTNGASSSLRRVHQNRLGPNKFGRKNYGNPEFVKGNKFALKSNMSPEAHQKRMEGLMRGWRTSERLRKGEKLMTFDKAKRERARLTESVRAEARDVQNFAREHAIELMERVMELARTSGKGADLIAAATLMLDRAYGKASQTTVNANVDANGKPTEITAKELNERIAEALRRVESLAGGEGEQESSQETPPDVCGGDRDPGNSSIH